MDRVWTAGREQPVESVERVWTGWDIVVAVANGPTIRRELPDDRPRD